MFAALLEKLRVVVREGFSRDLADIFLENLKQSMDKLSGKGIEKHQIIRQIGFILE